MTFLAPLDIVSARERVLLLFDFEYEWEVYKPEAQRRWGYYTLPILYQDRLVTRTDLMLERTTSMPVLKGFRLESYAVTDNQLITALANGFKRFMRLIEAQALEALFSASISGWDTGTAFYT